jgi:hypothetical protein
MNPIATRIKEEVLSILSGQEKAKKELQAKIDGNWLTNTFAASDFAYAVAAEAEVNTIGLSKEFVEDDISDNKLSMVSEVDLLNMLTSMVEDAEKRLEQIIKPTGTDSLPMVYGTQSALTRLKKMHKFANRIVNH